MKTCQAKSMTAVLIRWFIRRDLADVLAISRASFANPWREEDFLTALRQRNCIGMVAEHHEAVIGFMLYELAKGKLTLLNLAVHPDHRHRQVGTQMIDKLKGKLSHGNRTRIQAFVPETNLPAQLFFKAQNFLATYVDSGHFDSGEDAFHFHFVLAS